MITGELADVRVNAHVPLIAAELGYWQLGKEQVNTSISTRRDNRDFPDFGVHGMKAR